MSLFVKSSALCSLILAAAFGLSFLFAPPAHASCYAYGQGGRLGNFCAIDMIKGTLVDLRGVQLIDYKLKLEGNLAGLGLPLRVNKHQTTKSFQPILAYSDNINGGNSSAPLTLGSLTFTGDPNLYRQSGLIAGASAGIGGRFIYAEGRYLSYGLNGSYAHSPKHKIGIASANANLCNTSHIKNWLYFDSCVRTSRVHKEITDDKTHSLSLGLAKVLKSGSRSYSEAKVGVNRFFTGDYAQNQLQFGINTIHPKRIHSSFSLTFGEPVKNELASRFSISARINATVAERSLTLTASYAKADGGKLLGYDRDEKTYTAGISYPIWKNLSATIGYKVTQSNIDYFDISTPTFSIQLPSIDF